MTEKELIDKCVRQDRKAQEALYEIYKKPLFLLCMKYCQNQKEAEDNLHDAFIEIFSSIKNFKQLGSFEGWMKRITINKAITKYKSSFATKPLESAIYPVSDQEIEIEADFPSIEYILESIQELPNQYRIVFCLFELDNYSHKEIAAMLSISEGTSKSNLHKAKAILRNKINQFTPKQIQNGI